MQKKLLIVEDNSRVLEILAFAVGREGYHIIRASDGKTGLRLAQEQAPDLIVLDPPRDGVHPKALQKITDFGVERIVYIACKPTSLVRDLEMLQGRGYRVEKVGGIDMFPGTYHTEGAVLIQRKYI